MGSDSWLPYLCLVLLLLGAAYFASAETAFSSVNRIRIKTKAENGSKNAKKAWYILENFDKTLSTLLLGNNVVHIATASLATLIFSRIWGESAVAYTTVVTTVVVFLVGETIPKNIGKARSETLALSFAPSLRALMTLLTPFVFVLSWVAKLISRLFGNANDPTVTEEEINQMIENIQEETESSGDTAANENIDLIHSAFEFDDHTAQDVFTPRIDVDALPIDSTPEEIIAHIRESKHSRLVVYRDTIDDVAGILSIRKYLKAYYRQGTGTKLEELLDKPHFVHKTVRIDDLLREMSAQKVHLSVVTDDYGGTMGIITIEDILEELVGEIWDEDDEVTFDVRSIGGSRFEVMANVLMTDVFEQIGYEDFDEDEFAHLTAAGWVLDNIPTGAEEGSSFEYKNLTVSVLSMDGRRINRLIIKIEPTDNGEEVQA